MATRHQIPPLLLISLALTIITLVGASGITVDLIHRDSLLASDSATSHVDRLYDTFQRSIQRARAVTRATLAATSSAISAPVIPAGGEYLMDLSIGSPPKRFLGIVDTGSDLTWTQCAPCVQCFEQELPVFDPAKSTSYGSLTCDSNACDALSGNGRGCTAKNTCAYKYGYGDKSYTVGDLATETLTIGSEIKDFVFGCGHQNQGTFQDPVTGLVGLGQGPLSLSSQTKKNPAFGGKFAYCLIPFQGEFKEDVRSKFSFGDNAVITGDGVVSTPVVSGQVDTFYYLTLEGVSVGGKNLIPFKKHYGSGSGPDAAESEEGNIIIDSGTTLTILPEAMFDDVLSELKEQIKAEPVPDPRATLQLCYEGEVEVPKMTFHFTGASLEMGPTNTFVAVAENVVCLAMLPARQVAIFGNLAQINYVVSHDIDAQTVSFKPTDCTTYV